MVRDIQRGGFLDYKKVVVKISEKYTTPLFTSTLKICAVLFSIVQQPLVGKDLTIKASRSHSDTPHSVGLLWTRDQPDAESSTSYNVPHSQKTDIHAPAGLEPVIPEREWQQAKVFDGAVTGIDDVGSIDLRNVK
jgi:hypothetical protein